MRLETAIRPTRLHLGITVEPLLAQRGEEENTRTCVKDGQGISSHGIGAGLLRESGGGTSWVCPSGMLAII